MFTSYFFKRPCVPLQIVGNAVTVGLEPQPYPDDDPERPVVIVHSPSKPVHKGTAMITRMIEELRAEGFNERNIATVGPESVTGRGAEQSRGESASKRTVSEGRTR